eukprot:gene9841-11657_t
MRVSCLILLFSVGVQCAKQLIEAEGDYVPILLNVQSLTREVMRDNVAVGQGNLLLTYLRWLHGAGSAQLLMLTQVLDMRQALILVDGLDEAGPEAAEISRFILEELTHAGHRLLVATRPGGLQIDLRSFVFDAQFEVLPLTKAQQRSHVELRAEVMAATGTTFAKEQFLEQLAGHAELAQNPLMLPLLVAVFTRDGCLPKLRTAMVREVIQMVMARSVATSSGWVGGRVAPGTPRPAVSTPRPATPHAAESMMLSLAASKQTVVDKGIAVLARVVFSHYMLQKLDNLEKGAAEDAIGVDPQGLTTWQQIVHHAHTSHFPLLTCLRRDILHEGRAQGGDYLLAFTHPVVAEYLCSVELARLLTVGPVGPFPLLFELLNLPWWQRVVCLADEMVPNFYELLVRHYQADGPEGTLLLPGDMVLAEEPRRLAAVALQKAGNLKEAVFDGLEGGEPWSPVTMDPLVKALSRRPLEGTFPIILKFTDCELESEPVR